VRGAYGVFYQRVSSQAAIGMSINPPFVRTGDVVLGVNETDYRTYPIDDLTPVVNFIAPGSRPSVSGIHIDANDAYVQQWNLYLERMLTNNLVVKAGYVGTKSTGLEIARNPNTPLPGPGDVQARRPFNNLSSVRLFTAEGFATYHGLEVSADQRFSNGVSLTTSYTFSRTIDNQGALDPYNYALDKGLSAFHMAHRLNVAGVFEIPFGRGRKFGGDSHAVVNAILGGWQVSPIMVLRTGVPFSITTQGDLLNTGGGYTQVPNRIREATLPKEERSRSRYFDTEAFTRPGMYELGNAGRNILIGPGSRNLDLSITKLFSITERKALQFRAEAFNATNHPNWGNPGTTLGTAAFGTITSNENLPRVLQFGLKFIY
jgi:hypothetical protein